jgi:broad specificity phosphatase PhoE
LSDIYLVRHGQAGTRDAYDTLSELGRQQSRLLGDYFAAQDIRFSHAYSGALQRQRQTAAEVRDAYARSQSSFPNIEIEERWNEFNLDHIYRELAPVLCGEDAEFRAQYESMRDDVRLSRGNDSAVHRRWLPCDSTIVNAWISGRHPYSGETWSSFCARVASCRERMNGALGAPGSNVVVFTSAAPIGIWAGMALDIADNRVLRLAGVLHNASYTMMRLRGADLRLFSFNAVPHLNAPELRTHR